MCAARQGRPCARAPPTWARVAPKVTRRTPTLAGKNVPVGSLWGRGARKRMAGRCPATRGQPTSLPHPSRHPRGEGRSSRNRRATAPRPLPRAGALGLVEDRSPPCAESPTGAPYRPKLEDGPEPRRRATRRRGWPCGRPTSAAWPGAGAEPRWPPLRWCGGLLGRAPPSARWLRLSHWGPGRHGSGPLESSAPGSPGSGRALFALGGSSRLDAPASSRTAP